MIGRSIFTVVDEAFTAPLAAARERVSAGEHVGSFETRRRDKDGHAVEVEVTLSAIHDADGRIVGISGVFRDISERRRAEAELAQRSEERRVGEECGSSLDLGGRRIYKKKKKTICTHRIT